MDAPEVFSVLASAAMEVGFSVKTATIEAEGLCSTCRSATRLAARTEPPDE